VSAARKLGESPPPAQDLVLRWDEKSRPLPMREIRALAPGLSCPEWRAPAAWLRTGAEGEPFDFCGAMRRLCADVSARCAELRHVDVSRLLFAVTQARNGRARGLQARVTPLRFANGQLRRRRRAVTYQIQRYFLGSHEFLYLVTFCLPRFLDQSFDEKLVTLFHELYHISPAFDGDLRRHEGRYAIHSHSQREYDKRMLDLAQAYLDATLDASLYAFLRLDFAQLLQRHGSVVGVVVPHPKVIPVGDQP
jgi:predicted metallopeptidase